MKTNEFRKIVSVCLLVVAFVTFVSAKGKDEYSKFRYSSLGAKGLAESQIVCLSDKDSPYLTPSLKYLFTYDNEGRVIRKEVLKWNVLENDFVRSHSLMFAYTDDMMVAEYASWNEREEKYNECTERAIYEINARMFTSYSYYKKNQLEDDWILERKYLVNIPVKMHWDEDGILIAEAEE